MQNAITRSTLVAAALAAWAITTAGSPPADPLLIQSGPVGHAVVDGRHVQPRPSDAALQGTAGISANDAKILDQLYQKQMQSDRLGPSH